MSIASLVLWPEPETDSVQDLMIAEKALQFNVGYHKL
jgi:hypothetical protein